MREKTRFFPYLLLVPVFRYVTCLDASVIQISASYGFQEAAPKKFHNGTQMFIVLSMTDVNISCAVSGAELVGASVPRYLVTWTLPEARHASDGRVTNFSTSPLQNERVLLLRNATRDDDGLYRCEARVSSDDGIEQVLAQNVRLYVIKNPNVCNENWFRCHGKKSCIHPRYICDGQEDCNEPSDEAMDVCGRPCDGKVYCSEEGRCLSPEFCCPGLLSNQCTPDICCNFQLQLHANFSVHGDVGRTGRNWKEGLDASNLEYMQTYKFIVMVYRVQIIAGQYVAPPPSYNEAVQAGGGSNSGNNSRRHQQLRQEWSQSAFVPLLRDEMGPPPPYASRDTLAGLGAVADINQNNVESIEENNNHLPSRLDELVEEYAMFLANFRKEIREDGLGIARAGSDRRHRPRGGSITGESIGERKTFQEACFKWNLGRPSRATKRVLKFILGSGFTVLALGLSLSIVGFVISEEAASKRSEA
ncbi:unnamed protein product [Notodromas monacha]|uniref:Ig-like domain-containing protein n=1 Tax=Notodromas monacha TaxID=399045 RepID=A0A7R9BUF6_9CRUS|nr:unnamed protein product [Notodromas monacha]CAG0921597.1 unnamed protein product [Notodromas monacha]